MSTEYIKLTAKYNQLSSEERGKIEVYYEMGSVLLDRISKLCYI